MRCAVAARRLDGFYERGLNYWDWAAGALVAAEAGAVVGGLRGAPLSGSMAVAAGPALFGPLIDSYSPIAITHSLIGYPQPPSLAHPLGTDLIGRDIFDRVPQHLAEHQDPLV